MTARFAFAVVNLFEVEYMIPALKLFPAAGSTVRSHEKVTEVGVADSTVATRFPADSRS